MERHEVEAVLDRVEGALAERPLDPAELGELGFWRAVGAVKRRPGWVEDFADRIGTIDRRAFESSMGFTVPATVGTWLLALGTAGGLVLVGIAYFTPDPWNGLTLLAGTGTLLLTTHGLGHLVVGRAMGIRFSHWFLDGPSGVQPGAKIDYASYLRTPPRARAWMHASGALVTKSVPFLLVGAALAAGVPWWATWALVAIGVVTVLTDLFFSVRISDWKRFRREMAVARELS